MKERLIKIFMLHGLTATDAKNVANILMKATLDETQVQGVKNELNNDIPFEGGIGLDEVITYALMRIQDTKI